MHRRVEPLSPPDGYTVQVDMVDHDSWHALLDTFADASIYQAWAYEAARSALARVSHLVVRRADHVVAAAQLRIVKLPFVDVGVAYSRWGPMWRRRGQPADPQVLAVALEAIRHEYGLRRGLEVRVLPGETDDTGGSVKSLLATRGYERLQAERAQRTLIMSLDRTLPELRAGLDQKWRNCLNRGLKNDLVIVEGNEDELFARFIGIHKQMRDRKGYGGASDIEQLRAAQHRLPLHHRTRVLLASAAGELAAGLVCSQLGDVGLFLHGATSDAGMRSNASYVLQWRALEWLKARGASHYNLHGINPETNPGTYHFKAGLCGRSGRDVHYVGSHASPSGGRLLAWAGIVRNAYRRGWRQAMPQRLGSSQ